MEEIRKWHAGKAQGCHSLLPVDSGEEHDNESYKSTLLLPLQGWGLQRGQEDGSEDTIYREQ